MVYDLAQSHAFDLSRTLMIPVTLFRSSGEQYGALPSEELEDGEVEVIAEFDPWEEPAQ